MFIATGCDVQNEVSALEAMSDNEKLWVFTQFNVPEEKGGIESYYYYARISKSTYQGIKQNKLTKGFILLEEVKYWGDDNLIYDYKDIENSGEIIFRIENIAKVELINMAPIAGKGLEQFEDEPTANNKTPSTNREKSSQASKSVQ